MKKLFFLFLFFGFCSLANAQVTTTIYSMTGSGTYHTGYNWLTYGRYDNSMYSSGYYNYRCWAVFDLTTGIPAGARITSVTIGVHVIGYYGSGAATWSTYGYPGDLSTGFTAATSWPAMIAPSSTLINSASYGTFSGTDVVLPSTTAAKTFVASRIGNKLSISFTNTGGTSEYYFTGELGTAALTGAHRPYIQITYCMPLPSVFTATASASTLCAGSTLTLTGTHSTGYTGSNWAGPVTVTGSVTGDTGSVTGITTAGSGTYYFIVNDSLGCHDTLTVTPAITVNPLPAPITGVISPICALTPDTLHDVSTPGSWTMSPVTIGTLTPTGTAAVFIGATGGVATITFTNTSTGCKAVAPITVNAFPAPITGGPPNDTLCMGSTVTLHDTTAGGTGTWASAFTTIATITSTGVVTSVSPGTTIFKYTNPITGCGPAMYTMTVAQMPSYITGLHHICIASVDTMRDSVAGGKWTSSNPYIGIIATDSGWLTGYNVGNAIITYTMPGNCYRTYSYFVTGPPGPILNMQEACQGGTFIIYDSMSHGTWSNSNSAIATLTPLDSISAKIVALSPGTTMVTYSSCGYNVTDSVVVNPNPKPIMGRDSVCIGSSVTLFDSTDMGIWLSTNTGIATAAAAFGIITGVSYGFDTIKYMLPTGCFTKTRFFVDSLPAQITGTKILCPGTTTTLADVTGSGKWSSIHKNIATADSLTGVIHGVYAGLDTIVYTAGVGCITKAPITVNPLPAPIVGDTTICPADSMVLTDVTPGGKWRSTNLGVFTIDSLTGMLNTVDTNKDSAIIKYVLPTGCFSTIKILKHPVPHPIIAYDPSTGEDTVVNGYFWVDTVLHSSFSNYQWYNATTVGLIEGATSDHLAILYNEEYYVVVTDTFGCVGRSESHFVTFAKVKDVEGYSNIVIYPNPVGDVLHLLAAKNVDISISNIEGKNIINMKNTKDINVKDLPLGEYILSIFDNKGKLVKAEQFTKE